MSTVEQWREPHQKFMCGWAVANKLDPARVVEGSIYVTGRTIIYREAVEFMGDWVQRERTAPLLMSFQQFAEVSKR